MGPFPELKDLPKFDGDSIAQIWLDPYGVRFLFESRVDLYAQYKVEHAEPNGEVWIYDCEAADGPPIILHRLLYKPILAVIREELRLTFEIESGEKLSILSDIGMYESVHIRLPDGSLIVF